MSRAERELGTELVNHRTDEFDADDRAWLARRLEEYKDLLAYLREH